MPSKYRTISGVQGKVPLFSQKMFNKYDVKAREVVTETIGDIVKDNPNVYEEDMIFTTKEVPYKYLELQVCADWKYKDFPYVSPYVYARKMRYSKSTLFMTFNSSFDECIIFDRSSICEKPTRMYKYSREFIHLVPWYKALRVPIKYLSLRTIRRYACLPTDDTETDESEEEKKDEIKN